MPMAASHRSMMMEGLLSLRQKYLSVVTNLATPGALGVAVLLGTAAPGAASQEPVGQQPSAAQGERVSDRLAAIRDAVSAVSGAPEQTGKAVGEQRLAWGNWGGGWGGGGWGRPWGGGWGGGGGWGNPWGNWRNGWNNWRNGWGNW
jgi:rSAM-associated Gly-rich repeat protein